MDKAGRRAARAAYKERPLAWGVFAVRCTADDRLWIGSSRHLDTQQNGLWFALRMGSCMNKALQSAWAQAGENAFAFEVLYQMPSDTPGFRRVDLLKQQTGAWREALAAPAI
jgi:hypothetical protein